MDSGIKMLSVIKEQTDDVLNYLGSLQAGIICLQDAHEIDSDDRAIKQVWNGNCYIKAEKFKFKGSCNSNKG